MPEFDGEKDWWRYEESSQGSALQAPPPPPLSGRECQTSSLRPARAIETVQLYSLHPASLVTRPLQVACRVACVVLEGVCRTCRIFLLERVVRPLHAAALQCALHASKVDTQTHPHTACRASQGYRTARLIHYCLCAPSRAMLFRALASASILFLLARAADAPACATSCAAASCDNVGIRWGRFCGVTHTGCAGVEPCDAYDACCQSHDACVVGGGLSAEDQRCHSAFIRCLSAAAAAKSPPWSTACSARQVVRTMTDGIKLASAFAGILGGGPPRPRRGEL